MVFFLFNEEWFRLLISGDGKSGLLILATDRSCQSSKNIEKSPLDRVKDEIWRDADSETEREMKIEIKWGFSS